MLSTGTPVTQRASSVSSVWPRAGGQSLTPSTGTPVKQRASLHDYSIATRFLPINIGNIPVTVVLYCLSLEVVIIARRYIVFYIETSLDSYACFTQCIRYGQQFM